jgi:tripartite-type tricarboxylate transporter receptor subunit TctC
VAEFVAYAKANPNKLNYGSAGVGSAPHMSMALIAAKAGIQMVHIPFAGLGPATNALLAGTVDVALITPAQVKPHVDSGTLRALGVTSPKRSPVLPDVPTLQEAGLAVTAVVAYGLTAPARTPEPVLARLRQALAETTSDKAVADHFRALGIDLTPLIGDAYRDFIVKDLEQWRGVAKAANVRIEN